MTREEFNEQSLIDRIENRINAEYRKHKDLDWAKIAAIKIAHEVLSLYGSSLPPAEGAEEIYSVIEKRIERFFHIYQSYEAKELIVALEVIKRLIPPQEFTTLHAQRLAEKMVSERLREELIGYDKWMSSQKWGIRELLSPETTVNEYLKSREK